MEFLQKILPWIGAAATGNVPGLVAMAATAVSDALGHPVEASAEGIQAALTGATPQQIVAVRAADQEFSLKMQAMGFESLDKFNAHLAEAAGEVNATMRAEAVAEHWPTYSWRPFIGFVFGLYIASLFLLPLIEVQPVVMSPDMVLAVGSILGIASFYRGKMQADPTIPTINRG